MRILVFSLSIKVSIQQKNVDYRSTDKLRALAKTDAFLLTFCY